MRGTLADGLQTPSVPGRRRPQEVRNRSIRIRGLPDGTQEGLLQQLLEKLAAVKRVEVLADKREAVAELESPAVCLVPLGFHALSI
jgi:squamous cell carcinoma antigen recognized by T-cells 3